MSIIPFVISLILVVVIFTFLQLTPATFSIFYHYALGQHSSKKSDNLSLSFIFGVELFMAVMWLLIYFVIHAIYYSFPTFNYSLIFWILSGIAAAEAIIFFFYYFRRIKSTTKSRTKASTTLFLSRRFANHLTARARHVKSRKDAFALGFFVGVPELIFTLPLFIIGDLTIINSFILPSATIIIIAILAVTIPLFAVRTAFRADDNLADIQRFRAHIRPALRIFIPLCYLALAATLISMGIF